MIIYQATNTLNGKSYIGMTKNSLETRKSQHENSAINGSSSYFYNALRKNMEAFVWIVLEEVKIESLLPEREIYWIDKCKTHIQHGGYNLTSGGSGGDTISNNPNRNKIIENQSIAQKKMWNDERRIYYSNLLKGSNNPNYGKEFSNEHRRKISIAGIGNKNAAVPCSEEKKNKISNKLKGIPMLKVECPHCNLIGGNPIMKRYHFDNCKHIKK